MCILKKVLLLLFLLPAISFAGDTGWLSPNAVGVDSLDSCSWCLPTCSTYHGTFGNILTEDNADTVTDAGSPEQHSYPLFLSDFRASIPVGRTVTGVGVRLKVHRNATVSATTMRW